MINKTIEIYKKQMTNMKNGKRITPLQAIRLKCLDCSCYQPGEIKHCQVNNCPLYLFRFRKNQTGFKSKGGKMIN